MCSVLIFYCYSHIYHASEIKIQPSEIKRPMSENTRFDPSVYYLNFTIQFAITNENNAFKCLFEVSNE